MLDDGEGAIGEIRREEAQHGTAAEAEQQGSPRLRGDGDGDRHDAFIGKNEALRVQHAHRRLLRHQPILAQRGEVAADVAAARDVDDREPGAEGRRIALLEDFAIRAEEEGELVTLLHRAARWR